MYIPWRVPVMTLGSTSQTIPLGRIKRAREWIKLITTSGEAAKTEKEVSMRSINQDVVVETSSSNLHTSVEHKKLRVHTLDAT